MTDDLFEFGAETVDRAAPVVHDFDTSLALSHVHADAPWWLDVYRRAFPDLAAAVNVRSDGWAQRGGIDRVLTLASGKSLTIDEKVRDKDWPDFCLEYLSDVERQTRGWVAKDLACDFIAYAFVPSSRCYLLPFQSLRRAWRINHRAWVGQYRRVDAQNRTYVTRSVAVPIPIVLRALGDAMCVDWRSEAA